jgi:hypothetical protein
MNAVRRWRPFYVLGAVVAGLAAMLLLMFAFVTVPVFAFVGFYLLFLIVALLRSGRRP